MQGTTQRKTIALYQLDREQQFTRCRSLLAEYRQQNNEPLDLDQIDALLADLQSKRQKLLEQRALVLKARRSVDAR
jgi:hypothetical protein